MQRTNIYVAVFFLLLAGQFTGHAYAGPSSMDSSQCARSSENLEKEIASLSKQAAGCQLNGRCKQVRTNLNRAIQRMGSVRRLCSSTARAVSDSSGSSAASATAGGGISLTAAMPGAVAGLSAPGNPSVSASAVPAVATAVKAENPEFDRLNCKFWIFGCSSAPEVSYGDVDGELFVDGNGETSNVDASDVNQGGIGDCYYLASMAAIARQNPDVVRNQIRQNEDGTYSVDFYNKKGWWEFWKPDFTKETVTVDDLFPLNKDGTPAFAQFGDKSPDGKPETWAMAMEKAYADFRGNYNDIASGGWPEDAMEQLTGKKSQRYSADSITLAQIADWDKKGYAITMASRQKVSNKDVVAGHAYYLKGVDTEKKTISLGNPWGYNHVTLSEDEFRKNYSYVAINPIK